MHYLYGIKSGASPRLVATFDSQQQLQAYVRWATLKTNPDGTAKFEQGSVLSGGCNRWEEGDRPGSDDEVTGVPHNPSPSML